MPSAGKSASTAQSAPRPHHLAFTLDGTTGEVVKLETVDPSGHRHELSQSEKVELEKQTPAASLESLLEEAFEAGLACVLGEEDEQESSSETADEADVRRILLKPLMEGGSAARMMRREVLRQAIVRTMIQDIIKQADSRSGSATASKSDRAVS